MVAAMEPSNLSKNVKWHQSKKLPPRALEVVAAPMEAAGLEMEAAAMRRHAFRRRRQGSIR